MTPNNVSKGASVARLKLVLGLLALAGSAGCSDSNAPNMLGAGGSPPGFNADAALGASMAGGAGSSTDARPGTIDVALGDAGSIPTSCTLPVPAGFTHVLPPPMVGSWKTSATAFDAAGNPFFAFVWKNHRDSPTAVNNALYFMRWNACTNASEPVKIDNVGAIADLIPGVTLDAAPLRQVSLARDQVSGRLVVAYAKHLISGGNSIDTIWLSFSTDDGTTWSAPVRAGNTMTENASTPMVVANAGHVYLAFIQDEGACKGLLCAAVEYMEFTGENPPDPTPAPIFAPHSGAIENQQPGLALDAAGRPGLAYLLYDTNSMEDEALVYWKPGAVTPVLVTKTKQNRLPSRVLALAFAGSKPCVVSDLLVGSQSSLDLVFACATDDGAHWEAPITLPRDERDAPMPPLAMAIDPNGSAAVVAASSNIYPARKCGGPRIVRSADLQQFSACGASTDPALLYSGDSFNAAFDSNHKLVIGLLANYASFKSEKMNGFYVWHEP